MHPGAGADVDHVVGRADGVLVMLDDEHRVAHVAQVLQRLQQAVVVALMEADRRLVEHVHDAGQAGADLRRQPDALRLAAGQRFGRAFEAQVIEADVDQEAQPGGDFLEDLLGHLRPGAGQLQAVEVIARLAERQAADFVQRLVADAHVPRLDAQAGAGAGRAGRIADVLGQFLAHGVRVAAAVTPFEIGDDALEGMAAVEARALLVQVAEIDLGAPGTVEHQRANLFRQVVPRRVDRKAVMRRQRFDDLEIELVLLVPAANRAAGQRRGRLHDDALGVEELDHPEAVALRAGAHRVVEREQARLQFLQRIRADRAGELGREQVLDIALHFQRDGPSFGMAQRRLEGFGEALAHVVAHLQAVDDDIDGVLLRLGQLRHSVDFVNRAVDAHPRKTLGAQFGEQVHLLALAVGHHRRQDHQLRFGRQRQHRIDHLRHRLRRQRLVVLRAIRRAGAGEQQAQVIVDFGDRADGRPRVVRSRLLLDGNRRRQAFDQVDIRLLHQLQKLPGVGRQRFDVTPLALGIQGVEGE